MSLKATVDALVARLEAYTPTRDPFTRFRHDAHNSSERAYRSFRIIPPVMSRSIGANDGVIFTSDLDLEVFYPAKTQAHQLLLEAMQDQEELYALLAYFQGAEYLVDQVAFAEVNSIEIAKPDNRNEDLTVRLSIVLTYSRGA